MPRPNLLDLSELEDDLVPEILPSTASLSINGPVTALRALFARAAAVTPNKELVPGTGHALLEARPSTAERLAHVRLTASDGEQTVSVVDDSLTIRVPGSVLLPPKRVLDILKLAPTDTADISVVGSVALVRSGRARWTVQVPLGEVSAMTDLTLVSELPMRQIAAQPFLQALKAARVAASTTHARSSLMQVHLKDSCIIACDGGRLHRALVQDLDADVDTTVPVAVVDELIKALGDGDGVLEFGFDEQNLAFQVGDSIIVARRLLLGFPDVSNLVLTPKLTNNLRLVLDRMELADAIRRVRVNADPDVAVVTLEMVRGVRSATDWSLDVKSRDRVGNTAQESVECTWDGKAGAISFNHHHLSDLLEVCTGETVVLKLGTDTKSTRHPVMIEDDAVMGIVQQVTLHW